MVLETFIPIIQLSSGQRFAIYEQVRPRAEALGDTRLLAHIDRARAHERATRALESRWAVQRNGGEYAPEVHAADRQVDLTLVGIADIAEGMAKGLDPDHPTALASERLMAVIFPGGVAAVTSLRFVDQVLQVEGIVDQLTGPLSDQVAALGLSAKVAQLAEHNADYRQLLSQGSAALDFDQVRDARQQGQRYLCEMVAIVLGTYADSSDPDKVAARETLLEPAQAQIDAQRARTRARRRAAARTDEPADGVLDEVAGEVEAAPDAGDEATAAPDADDGTAPTDDDAVIA